MGRNKNYLDVIGACIRPHVPRMSLTKNWNLTSRNELPRSSQAPRCAGHTHASVPLILVDVNHPMMTSSCRVRLEASASGQNLDSTWSGWPNWVGQFAFVRFCYTSLSEPVGSTSPVGSLLVDSLRFFPFGSQAWAHPIHGSPMHLSLAVLDKMVPNVILIFQKLIVFKFEFGLQTTSMDTQNPTNGIDPVTVRKPAARHLDLVIQFWPARFAMAYLVQLDPGIKTASNSHYNLNFSFPKISWLYYSH